MPDIRRRSWFDQLLESLPEQVSFALITIGSLLLAHMIWTSFPADPDVERHQPKLNPQTEISDNTTVASNSNITAPVQQ